MSIPWKASEDAATWLADPPPEPVYCDAESDDYYCTLHKDHEAPHEAWTCTCRDGQRCANEPSTFVKEWV